MGIFWGVPATKRQDNEECKKRCKNKSNNCYTRCIHEDDDNNKESFQILDSDAYIQGRLLAPIL